MIVVIVVIYVVLLMLSFVILFSSLSRPKSQAMFGLQTPMPWSTERTRAMVKVLWQCSHLLLLADLALAQHIESVSHVRCSH